MRQREIPLTFQPSGKTVYVPEGTRVMEAAAVAGLALDLPCGGEGTCGKCRVTVVGGGGPPGAAEEKLLAAPDRQRGVRLACQTRVAGPMTVDVPEGTLLGSRQQILTHGGSASEVAADAAITKRYVELPPPERGGDEPDMVRLAAALGPLQADLELLRDLPGRLRETGFRGTAVRADGLLIDWEPGDTSATRFGVAVDVGTTTLVAALLDLATGQERALAARVNPQTRFGDDVLSRIVHSSKPRGLEELRQAVVEAVDAMIGELCAQAAIDRAAVYEVVFSGNTTMQQLLLGIDPRPLGEVPFVPATAAAVAVAAGGLGLHIHPRARAYVLPVIGGFVGGDTVAGMLATGLADLPQPALLVDIGTNGEIVLWAGGRLTAASTAAGPAFEGARISQGMRAGAGAIEKVSVDDRLRISVIGDAAPIGLCGSALIDLAAELLRHGVLSREGRLLAGDDLPQATPDDLRRRAVCDDGKTAFVLADEEESPTPRGVRVTQRDFRELQLAGGAIRAGIVILLKRAGLRPADLEAVLVGGGFGNFIRRSNAQRIGLLPPDVPRQRIRFQGNTSLAGARLVAISRSARAAAEELARRTGHVDLSSDGDFRWAFAEAMLFPDGEAG